MDLKNNDPDYVIYGDDIINTFYVFYNVSYQFTTHIKEKVINTQNKLYRMQGIIREIHREIIGE